MKTDSSMGFALRAPFYSPFLGGGLITSIIPVLVLQSSSTIVGFVCLAITIILLAICKFTGLLVQLEKNIADFQSKVS